MAQADAAALLNYVANQPEVLVGVAPGHPRLDLAPFLENPAREL